MFESLLILTFPAIDRSTGMASTVYSKDPLLFSTDLCAWNWREKGMTLEKIIILHNEVF